MLAQQKPYSPEHHGAVLAVFVAEALAVVKVEVNRVVVVRQLDVVKRYLLRNRFQMLIVKILLVPVTNDCTVVRFEIDFVQAKFAFVLVDVVFNIRRAWHFDFLVARFCAAPRGIKLETRLTLGSF